MADQPQIRQKAAAGRDANIAGRDIINNYYGSAEPGVPGLLPRDVPGFAGREDELARLAALVGGGRVVVSAIGGTAGVGKTALAVHAAHRLLEEFPDGHLYADLRGYTPGQDPAEPGEVLEMFLRRLGVPAEDIPAEVEERSGLLRQLLASRRVLMVLDNARSEEQVRPLLPGAGGSLVLVTSRSTLPGLEADERIDLDVLPEDEAATMLAGLAGPTRAEAGPQAVAEVAWLCGRLPLALRIAGQILAAHPAWPVAKLAGMLSAEQGRLTRLGAGDLQVRAAFAVSCAQLAEDDARLFRLLGLHPGPDFDTASAAALAGTDQGAAEAALGRLAEARLVTEDATGRFTMHDLLRLYARETSQQTDTPADRAEAETRLVSYYTKLARFLDACVAPQQRPAAEHAAKQAGTELPPMRQALAIFQANRPGLLAALDLAAQRGWDQQILQLSPSMSESLAILRYLDDLLTVHNAALAAARRAGDRYGEGQALTNLGTTYKELRRFTEAVDCYQQALEISREASDRYGEGLTLTNLGAAYRNLRRFTEAVDCYQQALEIFREAGDRYGEGQALNNLGLAYRHAGRFAEAVDCFQQALAIRRETGDRHGEGLTLNNLGAAYQKLRRFAEAVDCFQQALEIFREAGDRYGEGQALNNLGAAYQKLRRFAEAVDCFQQDIAICRETGDRYGEGLTLTNLGTAYHELRRFTEAADCWREAASAMRDTGDHEEAERFEQLATRAQSQSRRRWLSLRRKS